MTIRTIKRGKRIPKETQEALVQAYISDKNCTICQVCQRFGVSEVAARRILRSHGVEVRMIRKPWEPLEDELVCKMYQEGARPSEIARALNRSIQSVRYRLWKHGLSPSKAYQCPNPSQPKSTKSTAKSMILESDKIYKAQLKGGGTKEIDYLGVVKLIYLGKHGRHHLFRSKRGGWKVCFTDVQLADLKLEVA